MLLRLLIYFSSVVSLTLLTFPFRKKSDLLFDSNGLSPLCRESNYSSPEPDFQQPVWFLWQTREGPGNVSQFYLYFYIIIFIFYITGTLLWSLLTKQAHLLGCACETHAFCFQPEATKALCLCCVSFCCRMLASCHDSRWSDCGLLKWWQAARDNNYAVKLWWHLKEWTGHF